MEKKKVIVVDSALNVYERFKDSNEVKIVLLIVENDEQKVKVMQEKKVTDVYTFVEINSYMDSFVSKEEIDEYRSIQLKVERFNERFNDLCSYNIMTYYCALSFWLNKVKDIDTIFCVRNEHGAAVDSLLFEVAKRKGIPVFGPVSVFKNSKMQAFAIRCYNTGKTVNLYEIDADFNLTKIPLGDALVYKKTKEDEKKNKKINRQFNKCWIRNVFHQIFSSKGDVEYRGGIEFLLKPQKVIANILYVYRLKRYYDKISIKEVNFEKKGIFYALHYEPEASFMNKVQYDSQLYDINMLAKAVPEDWMIYVKEHPDQFHLVNRTKFMALKCIRKYRNKDFYDKIKQIPNVEILACNLKSDEIMKQSCIKAAASINGTIALECIKNNKNVILFDPESVVYGELVDVIGVKNIDTLKEDLKKLNEGKGFVDYGNSFEKLSQYVFVNYLESNPWVMPYTVLDFLFKNGKKYL